MKRRAFAKGGLSLAVASLLPRRASAGLLSISGGRGTAAPPEEEVVGGNNAARAQSYDAEWAWGSTGWVANAQAILDGNSLGQNPGMVIHIGDSLRRDNAFGAWAVSAAGANGKTAEDDAILEWMHADETPQSITSLNGFLLCRPYINGSRAYTVVDGQGPWDFWPDGGSSMPRTTVVATARTYMDDTQYFGIDGVTMLAAISRPQFATIEFNLNASDPGTIHADFVSICDYLESLGIVPIICSYTYRNVFADPQTATFNGYVDLYNPALEAFAFARGYPYIDINAEMHARVPLNNYGNAPNSADMDAWDARFLSGDGVHYTDGVGGNGSGEASDFYADGGDGATHTTGSHLTYNGYGLIQWLIVQKMKQIKTLVIDDPLTLPLYNMSNAEYLGSFLLPESSGTLLGDPHEGFRYSPEQGGGGIAFNPDGNEGAGSLFIQGTSVNNDKRNFIVAEVDIPEPVIDPAYSSANLNRASFLQSWGYICGTKNNINTALGGSGDAPNGFTCTGLMVHDGKLFSTHGGLYSNDPTPYGIFVRPSLDLSSTVCNGPYAAGSLNQRIVCNGIGGELPPNWQAVFDGNDWVIGGGGGLSTMNNACFGPGLHFTKRADYTGAGSTVKNATSAAYFTPIDSSGYSLQDDASAVWHGMSLHRGTIVLPESRTFIAYGFGGSDSFYDTGGVITGGVQGTYATGGTPRDRFYLYDAQDLKDAYDGVESPLNNVRPYAVYDLDFSYRNHNGTWIGETENMRSLTWDATNRKAYILETRGGGNSYPIVHVVSFPAVA